MKRSYSYHVALIKQFKYEHVPGLLKDILCKFEIEFENYQRNYKMRRKINNVAFLNRE